MPPLTFGSFRPFSFPAALLATALAGFAGAEGFLRSSFHWTLPPRAFRLIWGDDATMDASHRLYNLPPAPEMTSVLLFGSSDAGAVQEPVFLETWESLRRARSLRPARFINVVTLGQKVSGAGSYFRTVGGRLPPGSLVLVVVSPVYFNSTDPAKRYLQPLSPLRLRGGGEGGARERLRSWVLSRSMLFRVRGKMNARLRGSLRALRDRVFPGPELFRRLPAPGRWDWNRASPEKRLESIRIMERRMASGAWELLPDFVDMLAAAKREKIRVVVVETPLAPSVRSSLDVKGTLSDYETRVRRRCADQGAAYLNFNDAGLFREKHFKRIDKLNGGGCTLFTRTLVERLAALVENDPLP